VRAVVGAFELGDLAPPVKARAARTAFMVASVPEFTKRTASMLGMRLVRLSASLPRARSAGERHAARACSGDGLDDRSVGVAENELV